MPPTATFTFTTSTTTTTTTTNITTNTTITTTTIDEFYWRPMSLSTTSTGMEHCVEYF